MEGMEGASPGSGGQIYVTKLIGGKVFTAQFSADDSVAGEILNASGYSLIDAGEDLPRRVGRFSIECPRCGLSKGDFDKNGRFGCGECYRVFQPFLPALLGRIHPGLRHEGKAPRSNLSREVVEARLKRLQGELDQAVALEDFEAAARIRDELSAWKSSLS